MSKYHPWVALLRFYRHSRSTGRTRERERKCARRVCMSGFCKIKHDLKLLLCHISTQSAPRSCPPGQFGALAAANVYAENTWTEFELPYDVGLLLAVMSCWQQGLPQTHSLKQALKHTICCTSDPPPTPHTHLLNPLAVPINLYLHLYLSHTPSETHTSLTNQRGCDSDHSLPIGMK